LDKNLTEQNVTISERVAGGDNIIFILLPIRTYIPVMVVLIPATVPQPGLQNSCRM